MIDVLAAIQLHDSLVTRSNDLPSTAQTFTVTSVSGDQIGLSGTPSGDFTFGMIEVTASANQYAVGMVNVIESVQANVVKMTDPILGNLRAISVGDTVQLSGGPLGNAAFYYGMSSVREAMESGVEWFCTIEPKDGTRSIDTVGGGPSIKGKTGMLDTLGFTMTVETIQRPGGTHLDALHNYVKLPLFLHQCLYHVFRVRQQEKSNIWVTDDLTWEYYTHEREGTNSRFQVAICEFSLKSR